MENKMGKKLYKTAKSVETTTIINNETGEVKEQKKTIISAYGSTPEFVMFFVKDIKNLCNLTQGQADCLFSLLPVVAPTNLLNITGYVLQNLAKEKDVSVQQIRNWISQLCKAEILYRQGSGTYILNPYLFGRGNWNDVCDLRLTISYNAKNERKIEVEKKNTKKAKSGLIQSPLPLINSRAS